MARFLLLYPLLALASASEDVVFPTLPKEFTAVVQMKLPYIGLEMPIRVVTSSAAQKLEYYDGLEVDFSDADGTWKYTFNNSRRVCAYSPPSSGPTAAGRAALGAAESWAPLSFFPDPKQYAFAGYENVNGIMCQKFTASQAHGSTGAMDDSLSFFFDPVLGKPVRWHMHARHKIFDSHTDEYTMDFLTFRAAAPGSDEFERPAACKSPVRAEVSLQLKHFLKAGHGMPAPSGGDAHALLFDAYLRQYGKSHAPGEYSVRREIFQRNVELVRELNRKHAGKATFKGNQFLDMTREEVMRFRGGKRRGSSRERRLPEHRDFVRAHRADAQKLPESFDWRTAKPGSVSPVKDQAICGSCWAYGLTETVESRQAIMTGRMTELPEQFLVDCTWTNGTNGTGVGAGNMGCDGGDSDIGALEVIRKYGGVFPSAAAYGGYLSTNGYCKKEALPTMEVGAKITGWVDVKARDEEAVLHALVTKGPLSIGIMVPDEMLYYDSGVLDVQSCKYNDSQIDHAVTLTGYGTEGGKDYYVVRNSWSTYWGDMGYIKIKRGLNDCSVSSQAGYPEVAPTAAITESPVVV